MKSTLSIKVSNQDKLRLKRVAIKRNKTPSDLMREALELILSDPEVAAKESCFAVSEDLLPYDTGKLPRDLSTNKKYMSGFGK